MKQLSLSELTNALSDTPKTIGERLNILGFSDDDLRGKIPTDVLALSVYGSSFLKFLHDNAGKLEVDSAAIAAELPPNFVNAFDDATMTVGERLKALDIAEADAADMFSAEMLATTVSGDEFQDFIDSNQERFLNKLEQLATAPSDGTSTGGGN